MAQRLITLWARLRHSEDAIFAARLTALSDVTHGHNSRLPVSPFRAAVRSL